MTSPSGRLIDLWLRASRRRPVLILLAGLALLALMLPSVFSLRIDTDLARLLPDDMPEVRAMEELKDRVGDLGYLSVIVEGGSMEDRIDFARALEKRLGRSPWVRTVVYKNPVEFVQRTKYLWIPADRLAMIGDFLEKKHCDQNPFCVSVDEDGAPVEKADVKKELSLFRDRIGPLESLPEYHVSDDGSLLVLRLRPARGVTSLEDVRAMLDAVESEAEAVRGEVGRGALTTLVGGSLRARLDEYETVLGDVSRSGWVSGALILLMLLLAFRNPWAAILALLPLLFGMALTFCITALTVGHLNTVTALLFAVILGIGIDIGIHLISRYTSLTASGAEHSEALRTCLATTGLAVLVASLTTACGFLVMTVSSFRGFSHLGFIAGLGILCIALSYAVFFPVLTVLARRLGLGLAPWARLAPALRYRVPLFSGGGRRTAALLALALVLAGAAGLKGLSFNYDFDSLGADARAGAAAMKKQGLVYKKTLTPGGALFAPDEKTARLITEAYEKRMQAAGSSIERVVSLTTFIPEDQEKRIDELDRIAGHITPGVLRSIDDPELRSELEAMKNAAGLEPLTPDSLPVEVREMFVMNGGSHAYPVYLYGRGKLSNGRDAMQFQDEAGSIRVKGRTFTATGGALMYASVLRAVIRQGPVILAASLAMILLVVLVQMRSLQKGFLALLPLLLGSCGMVIVMTSSGMRLNIYNVAILSAVAGLGIDYGVHLVVHYWNLPAALSPPERALLTIRELFGPILFSWLTTSAGYVGLVISHHAGLRSIGLVALVGLGSCFLMAVTLLPMLLAARPDRRAGPHADRSPCRDAGSESGTTRFFASSNPAPQAPFVLTAPRESD